MYGTAPRCQIVSTRSCGNRSPRYHCWEKYTHESVCWASCTKAVMRPSLTWSSLYVFRVLKSVNPPRYEPHEGGRTLPQVVVDAALAPVRAGAATAAAATSAASAGTANSPSLATEENVTSGARARHGELAGLDQLDSVLI